MRPDGAPTQGVERPASAARPGVQRGYGVGRGAGASNCPESPNSKEARIGPKHSSLYPKLFALPSPRRTLNPIHVDPGGESWETHWRARAAAAEEPRPRNQPKCWVLSPDLIAAPPVKKTSSASGSEKRATGGGTGEGGARSLPAARLATAGGCRRLQYRRPEAAPRSRKEAAMLPPARLPR